MPTADCRLPRHLSRPNWRRNAGFSLFELICVIVILGALAAIAVPRYIAMGTDARIAAVNTMAGALQTAAANVHTLCKLDPNCDYTRSGQTVHIGGLAASVNYGWPEAGDSVGNGEIDIWVNYTGFSVGLPDNENSLFKLDGAPDPLHCAANYQAAYYHPSGPVVSVITSGC